MNVRKLVVAILCSAFVAACGGGGGDGPEDIVKDDQTVRELDWVYDKMKSEYLWYKETPDVDAQSFSTAADLLDAMKVQSKDRFSYIIGAQQNSDNQQAVSTTFGFRVYTGVQPFQIVRVYKGGSADRAGVERADLITRIGGVSITDEASGDAAWDLVREGLGEEGYTLEFAFEREDGTVWSETLESEVLSRQTLDSYGSFTLNGGSDVVGYMSLYEWRSKTGDELRNAFEYFGTKSIDSLVIDLRYNQGGSIRTVAELGSLILGGVSAGSPFIDFRFSDLGEVIFENEGFTTGYELGEEANSVSTIERVHIITSDRTCSASEILINSLRSYMDVQVTGTTTCGKPHGFYGRKFEDKSVLWAINFQSDNADGEGGWINGLQPTCPLEGFGIYPWGDRRDKHLESALDYITTGSCQPQTVVSEQLTRRASPGSPVVNSRTLEFQIDPSVDRM